MKLINRAPSDLSVGDKIVLGGSDYEVDQIIWDGDNHRYIIAYDRQNGTLFCKSEDELTVIVE